MKREYHNGLPVLTKAEYKEGLTPDNLANERLIRRVTWGWLLVMLLVVLALIFL